MTQDLLIMGWINLFFMNRHEFLQTVIHFFFWFWQYFKLFAYRSQHKLLGHVEGSCSISVTENDCWSVFKTTDGVASCLAAILMNEAVSLSICINGCIVNFAEACCKLSINEIDGNEVPKYKNFGHKIFFLQKLSQDFLLISKKIDTFRIIEFYILCGFWKKKVFKRLLLFSRLKIVLFFFWL